MRVCIVTPGPLGSTPRVVKEATALAEAQHDVTVISTRTLDLVDERDRDVLSTAKWLSVRIDLRTAQNRLVGRLIQSATGESLFTHYLTSEAKKIRADLYIAHYPPALPAVSTAAKRHRARYAFDAEDFHPGDDEGRRRAVETIEKRYLPSCSHITVASPGIADAYAANYGIKPPTVILNTFPRQNGPKAPTPAGNAIGPSVYWFSQTIGPNRGLECAVKAIALASSRPHLYLRGTPAGGFVELLSGLAAELHCSDRLHILPPANPSAMERLAADYDVGLVGETGHTINRQIALTNKQFVYFVAGIPAVMSDIPAHRDIAAGLDGAVMLYAVDNATDLAQKLDVILEPIRLARSRSAAFKLGCERFNWDNEKHKLLNIIQS